MDLDFSRCRNQPFAHQRLGVNEIFKWSEPAKGRELGGIFALFDEMGAGKTKQTIDAGQFLYDAGHVTTILVLAPAGVRAVWFDQELGELAKHLWLDLPSRIIEVHARDRVWEFGPPTPNRLTWAITNYEFIRRKERLKQLLQFTGPKTLIVMDESSAIKNHKAQQTKAALELRNKCGRALLLNGTPIGNSPMDMFSQGNMLDPRILACSTYYVFRSRYAVINTYGGFPKITGWQNLEDLQRRFKPYVLRRLKVECLDLPPKLDPVTISVPLDAETWSLYRNMRDDFMAWLDQTTVSTAGQAVVKAMRLRQITSGFLGGVFESEHAQPDLLDEEIEPEPEWLRAMSEALLDQPTISQVTRSGQGPGNPTLNELTLPQGATGINELWPNNTREVGREKLDAFLDWLEAQLIADPSLKLLAWCCFRPELLRIVAEIRKKVEQANSAAFEDIGKRAFRGLLVGAITGGQKKPERQEALRLLDPRTAPSGPVVVVGSPRAGGKGLNLTASHTVIYISNDYSLETRDQSEDRVHRPGQLLPVSYFDIIATGPSGQKTIDHAIAKALREKSSMASWTTSAWRVALTQED